MEAQEATKPPAERAQVDPAEVFRRCCAALCTWCAGDRIDGLTFTGELRETVLGRNEHDPRSVLRSRWEHVATFPDGVTEYRLFCEAYRIRNAVRL